MNGRMSAGRTLGIVAIAALTVGFWATRGESQQADKVADFMQAKLGHSQKVLEGLVTEDFDMIAKNSQNMSLLSQAAAWQVLQTVEYSERSSEFRRSVESLTEAAKAKNLEGAALAYVNVTMNCVNCHKYVRKVRMAQDDRPGRLRR